MPNFRRSKIFFLSLMILSMPIDAKSSCMDLFSNSRRDYVGKTSAGLKKQMSETLSKAVAAGDFKNIRFEVWDPYGRSVFQFQKGHFSITEPQPVLSASKWISTAAIMKLVESGLMNLNDKVGDYIVKRSGARLSESFASISLKQLLSFTSGIPGEPAHFLKTDVTLEETVFQLFEELNPNFVPGVRFDYNDNHLQVASLMAIRAVENRTGIRKKFETIVDELIGQNLEFSKIEYFAKPRKREGTENPRAAAGLRISFADYRKFLQMIFDRGMYNGRRVLSEKTIEEMEMQHAQKTDEENKFYGLGNWQICGKAICQFVDSMSPGYAGWLPVVNRSVGYTAILGANEPGNASPKSVALYADLRPLIQGLLLSKVGESR